MDILVIGGTRFVGRYMVEVALTKGHQVTLFNRGTSNPDIFPEAEHLIGDRDGQLDALIGRKWDVVLDTCGYLPRIVKQSVILLSEIVESYVFISTISVYAGDEGGRDEGAELASIEDESVEEITGETYRALKVLCEQTVTEAYSDRSLIIRPGLVVGPHDPTDRFTYWPVRLTTYNEVLAPHTPDHPVQFIDTRDLGKWTISMIEQHESGTYNATGTTDLVLGDVIQTTAEVTGKSSDIVWADEEFLLSHEVQPWSDLPLWLPSSAYGAMRSLIDRAIAKGLTHRPLKETVHDVLDWHQTRPNDYEWKAGINRHREEELIMEWKNQTSSK